MEC
jgi:2-dehydro-3-deoxyphosphogluconate aldolase/(4S)-4-hydroxy-2-oxoglutarate aldolase